MTAAALALAMAVLVGGGPTRVRRRITVPRAPVTGRGHGHAPDPLAAASALDVLAVCLSAGLSIPASARAAAQAAPRPLADLLQRAADLLVLGAEPDIAFGAGGRDVDDPHCLALLRLARRAASSGTALAGGVAELADTVRHDAGDAAEAAAERAAVVIAGPLGLCFLPAFVCLGVVPVVVGLAADVLGAGLL